METIEEETGEDLITVENPTDEILIVPVSYSQHGMDRIPDYRKVEPGESIEVSRDAFPVCIKMGCTGTLPAEESAEEPAEEEPAEEETPAEEPAEEEAPAEEPAEEAPVEETPAEEEAPPGEGKPTSRWTKSELEEYAKKEGIEVEESDTKQSLLNKITGR